jgi:predicted negative regulator of RcsB-dependent stress response
MSAQSLFSKKNIKAHQPDTRTGIMEELNLPPQVISFVRNNSRNLQIGVVCFLVLVLSWIFYDYYTQKQEGDAASLLASAMQTETKEDRIQVLENVINDYSRTDAARWSRLELAHQDYQDGRFDAAIMKFEETLAKIPAESSLVPLVRLSLAQSYEEAGQYDKAISQYGLLKKISGFQEESHLALGRIYTAKDDQVKARKEYEELMNNLGDEADPLLRSRVQALLVSAGGEKTIATTQPEENKE